MSEPRPERSDRDGSSEAGGSCSIGDGESASDRWSRRVWATGSYEKIAPKYVSMGGHLVDRTAVDSDDEVLDVGCGTGTVAITAARRGARVTGVDIQPAMIEHARTNADTADVAVTWREGDATALPFETNEFTVTLSNLGHVYGDPPDTAAEELRRVTRPGGRIGFTSWTPTSLYPAMAGVVGAVLSPEELPNFSEPPFLWGDSGTVRTRLGDAVDDIAFETQTVQYPALSPEHFWGQTAANSGMFIEILEDVDEGDARELREQLLETIEPYFDDSENAVELEYRLTTATVAEPGE
ncbi:class I SAM-dependent methyltransferase [Natrarchaeobius chitinivorans]|uniref:Class I SAM-dependent methyltransferase n=1 Tax=Natrarchaeobius chitinivorans TaxID=1679083 RepID=A0A3N6N2L9_NATCH|nr:class I SAM-dependent methyltransferase [Natrarchaeobius chitinivorans]RQG92272.1 class I SAM-dependent methyltransferase [Natrarchaeobius chitinivorans]